MTIDNLRNLLSMRNLLAFGCEALIIDLALTSSRNIGAPSRTTVTDTVESPVVGSVSFRNSRRANRARRSVYINPTHSAIIKLLTSIRKTKGNILGTIVSKTALSKLSRIICSGHAITRRNGTQINIVISILPVIINRMRR
ncbi:hypothetical protein D3C76_250560 [compost metagenome]